MTVYNKMIEFTSSIRELIKAKHKGNFQLMFSQHDFKVLVPNSCSIENKVFSVKIPDDPGVCFVSSDNMNEWGSW